MKYYFQIDKIEIRQASPADAEVMFMLIDKNRDNFAAVFPWVHGIKTPDEQRSFYSQSLRLWEIQREFHFVIYYEGKRVGALSVHSIKWEAKEAQFGYWIDKDSEGKGIISKSITEVEQGLRDLGLNRFVIRFHQTNKRSQRVAEILGYKTDLEFKVSDDTVALVKN